MVSIIWTFLDNFLDSDGKPKTNVSLNWLNANLSNMARKKDGPESNVHRSTPPTVLAKTTSQLDLWELRVRFIAAVQENDLFTARTILEEHCPTGRFEPDECYSASETISVICVAIERGYPEMVKLLIEFGCSVNRYVSGFSPLHYAAANGSVEITETLLNERANITAISDHGNTPLQLAAQTKSHEVVELLLKAGSNIEKANPNGQTPLSIACLNSRYETARILLNYGADVNSVDNNGVTPLLHAIDQYFTIDPLLVKLLLDAGANPDHMSNSGELALVTAVRRSSESNLDGQYTVKELIDHNCNIDSSEVGYLNQNAMHVAISRHQDRLIEILVRAGSDLSIRGPDNFTPLERLAAVGNTNMVKLMLAAGAKPELCKKAWERLAALRDETSYPLQCLITEWCNRLPSLQHLCRVRMRRYWGRHADRIIANHLLIPPTVERYLLLLNL